MAVDFFIKQGDTAPAIVASLTDADGEIVPLTGATVMFIMKDKLSGEVVVEADGTVTDASGGVVKYDWQPGDTDVPNPYNAEFEVHFADGTYETFPNSKYIVVKVITDLGGAVG